MTAKRDRFSQGLFYIVYSVIFNDHFGSDRFAGASVNLLFFGTLGTLICVKQ